MSWDSNIDWNFSCELSSRETRNSYSPIFFTCEFKGMMSPEKIGHIMYSYLRRRFNRRIEMKILERTNKLERKQYYYGGA